MAKLYFRYGAMNCGKTASLLQVIHNYEEKNMKVILLKPSIDTKGDDMVISRIGLKRKVDYLIDNTDNIFDKISNNIDDIVCIVVDEAQFLSGDQINDLWLISKVKNIPVICYGLRTDFMMEGFPGSIALLEIADDIEEMKTICKCGKKATINVRKENGKYVFSGEQIAIDNDKFIEYESICGNCYIELLRQKEND